MSAKTVVDLSVTFPPGQSMVVIPPFYQNAREQMRVVIDTTRTDGKIGIIFGDGRSADHPNVGVRQPGWTMLIPTAQLIAAANA